MQLQNLFLLADLSRRKEIQKLVLKTDYEHLLDQFKAACATGDETRKKEIEIALIAKKLCEIYRVDSLDGLKNQIKALAEYFSNRFPGQKDTPQASLTKPPPSSGGAASARCPPPTSGGRSTARAPRLRARVPPAR